MHSSSQVMALRMLVGMGKMSIDMMIKDNRYPLGYAAAITAAAWCSATCGWR